MKKKILMMLVVMIITTQFAACGGNTQSTADGAITFTDMTGREITLDEPASRIVALSAADCEILYALGAGDLIVGRGEYCDYPAAVLDKPSVATGTELNVEQVMALNPQIVIMTGMAQSTEQVEALEAGGAKVVVIYAQSIAGVYEAIGIMGQIVDKNDEADALVDEMEKTFADVAAKSSGDGSETIYFEVSPLEWGIWTAGSGTFMDELATMLGLTNVFSDAQDWAAVSEEQVIERNPDYIVSTTMYFGEGPLPVDEILGRTGWENINAVKNGKVINADNDEITRPGPRLMDAAESLYDFIYGS